MKILVYDLETAPNLAYVWGRWQQNVAMSQIEEETYILSYAARWYGSKEIMWRSDLHHGQKELLNGLWALLDEADVVVAHNGFKFDNRHCRAAFLRNGMKPPSKFHTVDTLRVARRNFKLNSLLRS